jgi:gamma-butyrobetaine dioxygenase/trimethyllysine dioxygenase
MSGQRVELRDHHLRVVDGAWRADFHLRWLRHNCDLDRHPATGERTVDSAELPDALAIREARIDGGELWVIWSHDERTSAYPLAWLRAHAYAIDRAVLRATGGGPPEDRTEALIDALTARGLRVIPTHFGRIEDLRTDNTTNANTDQLGYTDAAIELHTDQPILDEPPRYQLLHSIRAADAGGDSLLADARAAFHYLAAEDAGAAELLRTTPVVFHRRQRAFERTVTTPLIVDEPGRFQVRSSYFTLAPFRLPFARMDAWYRAYDRFTRLVRDPRYRYQFALAPGDALLYDNHRVLHGRTAFHGPRWMRGVYFDR